MGTALLSIVQRGQFCGLVGGDKRVDQWIQVAV
jgi:hypothetical protein